MFPELVTASADITFRDAGPTSKDVVAGHRRYHVRIGADAHPAAQHGLHFLAGRLRYGLGPFCARRIDLANPSTAETEQVRAGAAALRDDFLGDRLSNVVFMGMGSRWPTTPECWPQFGTRGRRPVSISARAVTVSTVGLAPAIRNLADARLGDFWR